jgi:signal transduction histidine kinase/CheY-like chemotaxis protein
LRPRPDQVFDYREYPVLYVDDEPENLRLFKLAFKREFEIVTATSGEEALEKLNGHPIAVILSDHRMPGMSGVEFLGRARDLDPKSIRILVTAYGDAETLREAVNSGSIYKFVPKPWQPDEMRMTVRRAVEAYALDREREQLLGELGLLNRVAKSLTQELEMDRLIALLLTTLTEELGYDGAGVLFFDAAEQVLGNGHFLPADDPVATTLQELSISDVRAPGFLRRLRDGEVQRLRVEDAFELEAPLRHWVTEVAAEELLVVPLLGKERAIGAIAVDNRRGGQAFSGDDQTLLEGLSHQAGIALQNARLVEDLRRSREQVRRADRLGTLGTLAAGLAHEINNPLVSIHTFLSMAPEKREEQDSEFWGDYHALACQEVDRIRRLVETMRGLGRDAGSEAPREQIDVGELAAGVVALVEREAGRARVEVEHEREGEPAPVLAVRDHVHQVVLNLVLNAIHASPAGGSVRIRTYPAPEGSAVGIDVSDSGEGIPEEHLSRIFDPFFTTKDPDEGTGLGLMICHRLVADHGGTIEVRSAEGEGSTFCVRLPLDGSAAEADEDAPEASPEP